MQAKKHSAPSTIAIAMALAFCDGGPILDRTSGFLADP